MIVADLSSQLDVEGVITSAAKVLVRTSSKKITVHGAKVLVCFNVCSSCSVGYGTYYSLFVRFSVVLVDY